MANLRHSNENILFKFCTYICIIPVSRHMTIVDVFIRWPSVSSVCELSWTEEVLSQVKPKIASTGPWWHIKWMFHSVEFSILLSLLHLTCYSFRSRCLFFSMIPCRLFQLFFHTNCVSWFLVLILGVCDDLHIFVSFLRTFWPPFFLLVFYFSLEICCCFAIVSLSIVI